MAREADVTVSQLLGNENIPATVEGDNQLVWIFQPKKPLVRPKLVKQLSTQMYRLHSWYMREAELGLTGLMAGFGSGSSRMLAVNENQSCDGQRRGNRGIIYVHTMFARTFVNKLNGSKIQELVSFIKTSLCFFVINPRSFIKWKKRFVFSNKPLHWGGPRQQPATDSSRARDLLTTPPPRSSRRSPPRSSQRSPASIHAGSRRRRAAEAFAPSRASCGAPPRSGAQAEHLAIEEILTDGGHRRRGGSLPTMSVTTLSFTIHKKTSQATASHPHLDPPPACILHCIILPASGLRTLRRTGAQADVVRSGPYTFRSQPHPLDRVSEELLATEEILTSGGRACTRAAK
ncbi:uncharacterized protein LOC123396656 [Hordeum vulgare subsp. vulgare]|uniref:uncharacterized protein LOC123396656 n=1 Tax=Hordeum vulgare subsp. vulgare TaxID=112509 RepID=UPI001D1A431C|nr:uncharacterized protein LOC123396656 [Hordeum vulgare subsp. vulgare]